MSKPTKEQVRQWQQERVKSPAPPPSLEEVRRVLGWKLVEAERAQRRPR